MGMCAAEVLRFDLPQTGKQLFTFIETDGCFCDGVSVSTGCWVGRRTLRVMDFGKMAATFVDTHTERAVRIAPHPEARLFVDQYARQAEDQWHAYLEAYQSMPLDKLLIMQSVRLTVSMSAIINREGAKAYCSQCGEEIFNECEVQFEDQTLCRSCAGQAYYGALLNSELHWDVLTSVSEGVICKFPW
jgi:formylmethanofuran dehydrogenase subunit E